MVKKRYNPKYQDAGRREKEVMYRYFVNPATMDRVRDAIIDEVVLKRRYLEKGLRATEVAKVIEVDPRTLSATMTTHFHTCFRDWVNGYRCDYAMTLLRDPRKKDLLMREIAEMCGFATQQAFYKAFWRHRGITPLQYRRQEI